MTTLQQLTIAELRSERTLSGLLERVHLIEGVDAGTVAQNVDAFLGKTVRDAGYTLSVVSARR